ncbi:hypothetical protein Lal_00046265 [Lupinus albus]|nr:hypothetical protein Lal_00046265 [Lupinus albus]
MTIQLIGRFHSIPRNMFWSFLISKLPSGGVQTPSNRDINEFSSTSEDVLIYLELVVAGYILYSEELIHFQLLEQAPEGQPSPKPLQFTGSIVEHAIVVLVDIGSSYNVIQSLGHLLNPTIPIMVSSGVHIYYIGLHSYPTIFRIPFYLLPIKDDGVGSTQTLTTPISLLLPPAQKSNKFSLNLTKFSKHLILYPQSKIMTITYHYCPSYPQYQLNLTDISTLKKRSCQ